MYLPKAYPSLEEVAPELNNDVAVDAAVLVVAVAVLVAGVVRLVAGFGLLCQP